MQWNWLSMYLYLYGTFTRKTTLGHLCAPHLYLYRTRLGLLQRYRSSLFHFNPLVLCFHRWSSIWSAWITPSNSRPSTLTFLIQRKPFNGSTGQPISIEPCSHCLDKLFDFAERHCNGIVVELYHTETMSVCAEALFLCRYASWLSDHSTASSNRPFWSFRILCTL